MIDSSGPEVPAFIVAGTHSGVGKTTVTLTLLHAMARRGVSVQPFKLGPDFIDTAYHTEMAGRPSINLDLWMMGAENIRRSFDHFRAAADLAVVESMGALFDGENGTDRGSAAFLAKLLDVPVVLVIDIWGMTRSATALLEGFLAFDPGVKFAGFVMNRAGSERHAQMVLDALPDPLRAASLGYIQRHDLLEIPERHLGLVTVGENKAGLAARLPALERAGSTLEVDRLIPARRRPYAPAASPALIARRDRHKATIAIARDPAFCFYYQENLALLEQAGALLRPFSPVSDGTVPADADGVYIGGGYPESFAVELAQNHSMRMDLRRLARLSIPIYAECGGFMYLGRTLTTAGQDRAPMAGLFPLDIAMDPAHLAIRYVAVKTLTASPLGPAGTEARGQEFHQSRIVGPSNGQPMYEITSSTGENHREGQISGNTVGSYIHLHFASNPEIPRTFVDSSRACRERRARPG